MYTAFLLQICFTYNIVSVKLHKYGNKKEEDNNMHLESGKGSLIRLIAGFFVLASVSLGVYLNNKYYFVFTGFVGFMLMVSSITGFCPMGCILKACGVKESENDNKSCCR